MLNNKLINANNSMNFWQKAADNSEYTYTHSYQAMGTTIDIKVNTSDSEGRKITKKVIQLIDNIEEIMNFHNPSSQISKVNCKAGKSWVSVNTELYFVVSESKRYAHFTKGFFDITTGVLTAVWNHYTKVKNIPPHYLVEEALKLVNYKDILINKKNKKVKLKREGQKIDLGGIAKGYAANQVIELFRKMGFTSGLINLGGNVSLLGTNLERQPWVVGIQNPNRERGKSLGVVFLSDTSAVTSGDYERYFQKNNIVYHHILSPYTGYPARGGLRSVTVIHPDSMLSDVLSTTIFTIGLEKGIGIIKSLSEVEVIIVTDNRIYLSSGLVKKFHLIEKGFSIFKI
ncbi:MAG: FAD:protein FMN transferase [Atribacterota bacterium]|nr:FAD:protein FMN transferase [Atribacterota bacterium]MDI9597199.1 FAD:protein FMN transferase [Atribacterota bacterium]